MQQHRKQSAARRSYGTGSLFARSDSAGRQTWYGKWWSNGRQVKRRIGLKRCDGSRGGLTRAQAEGELRRLIAETSAPAPVSEVLTIAELGRRYVAHLERQGRKKATLVAVRSILANWLEPHFGDRSINAIKPEDVVDLMRRMEAGGVGRRRNKPVGPKSIRNYIGTLSALFNYAERKRWATTNPVRQVDLPGVQRDEDIRFLDPHEVEALADGAVDGAPTGRSTARSISRQR